MSLLGTYLLISLGFVFAAMAEFALVLFVKQIQAWKNLEENCERNCVKSEKTPMYKVKEVSNASPNVGYETTNAVALPKATDQEARNIGAWSRKSAKLHGLSLTTKMDFAGFILFYFSYTIFNFVYLVPVLNYLYDTD